MINLNEWATVRKECLDALEVVAVSKKAAEWDRQTNNVKEFKAAIKTEGMRIQHDRCAWCTLPIGARGRRTAHRDHIAPKKQYPKWTFLPKNLVLTCEYCNGFSVKCDLDTIQTEAENYDDIEFHIVHPYIDEVDQHVKFSLDATGHGVVIEGVSEKGRWTIKEMQLDDGHLTVLRAQEYAYQAMINSLPAHYAQLFSEATGR